MGSIGLPEFEAKISVYPEAAGPLMLTLYLLKFFVTPFLVTENVLGLLSPSRLGSVSISDLPVQYKPA